eukprot:3697338-Pyramimonas_sp.AAC.1
MGLNSLGGRHCLLAIGAANGLPGTRICCEYVRVSSAMRRRVWPSRVGLLAGAKQSDSIDN